MIHSWVFALKELHGYLDCGSIRLPNSNAYIDDLLPDNDPSSTDTPEF
jgi:hypothetical protein